MFAHGAAIATVFLVSIPLWFKIAATAALLVHLPVVVARRALLLAPDAVMAIEISTDNKVSAQMRSSGWEEYEVLGNTFVMPYLTILNLQQAGGRAIKRVALLPDSLHAEDFRKLRVWLRWKEDDQPR